MSLGRVVAIANRGEIAIRIARTLRPAGWQPVVLLGEPDIESYVARDIGRVELVGPAGSELDPRLVIAAALRAGAVALHPGYGFLSERPELSSLCREHGITFIGPSPETLALCGDKIATREVAVRCGAPVLAASNPLALDDESGWLAAAEQIGFPLIAKIAGGGGGRGLRVARGPEELRSAVRSAAREAGASGAGDRLYLERYLEGARHVEVQVAGNGDRAVALGDRDCSIQRRHQKVIEEAPAPGLSDELRAEMHGHAVALAESVELQGVATVEFLLGAGGQLVFLEINPRLQVEHTVTEEVAGVDLVGVQVSLAYTTDLPAVQEPTGHAIQARLYAEDPLNGFAPNPGTIRALAWPRLPHLRVDSGYEAGDTIPDAYDSMIAKIIVAGATRDSAVRRLREACAAIEIGGVATNRAWLFHLAGSDAFARAEHNLSTAEAFRLPDAARAPLDLAPVVARLLHAQASGAAWDAAGPFRLVGQASQVFHGDESGGWDHRVELRRTRSGWTVDDPGHPAEDAPRDCPSLVLERPDGFELSNATGRWIVKTGVRPHAGSETARQDGMVRAPMPGTVVAVNVTTGQPVSEGEVLVVMTAMKIEIALAAPFAGVVSSLACAPGDLAGSRQVLAVVAPSESKETEAERD
ncbi:MAG TPA: biotin carboxylase N-terminal domain-containing protein [Thermomicrobiales bacterium]|nr:biotin carboxylase N-terminal domain-containing protein [Thermomicrobiales bacterium]